MNYKLFDEFITLQALFKELGIIQSGGAIKAFLLENQVEVNGEMETRRGRKLRVGDRIEVIGDKEIITITQPSPEEIEDYQADKLEKERVAQLVKNLNKEQKQKKIQNQKKRRTNGNPFVSQGHNMWLKSIHIQKFRNYKEVDLQFHSGLNIFLGQNAQGKTNLLESIYFLALTRSHRTRSDKDLIHFQEEQFTVSGMVEKRPALYL